MKTFFFTLITSVNTFEVNENDLFSTDEFLSGSKRTTIPSKYVQIKRIFFSATPKSVIKVWHFLINLPTTNKKSRNFV